MNVGIIVIWKPQYLNDPILGRGKDTYTPLNKHVEIIATKEDFEQGLFWYIQYNTIAIKITTTLIQCCEEHNSKAFWALIGYVATLNDRGYDHSHH